MWGVNVTALLLGKPEVAVIEGRDRVGGIEGREQMSDMGVWQERGKQVSNPGVQVRWETGNWW